MWMQGSTYTQPWHYEKLEWLALRSADFTPGKALGNNFYRRLSEPQDQTGHEGVKKITPPTPEIKHGTSSP